MAQVCALQEARDEEHAARVVAQWESHTADVAAMRDAHDAQLGEMRGEVAELRGEARVLARGLRPLRVRCYELQCQKGLLTAQLRHAGRALAASRADARRVHDDLVHLSRALTGKDPDESPPPDAPGASTGARRRWARATLAVLAALRLRRMAATPGGYLGLPVRMGGATISLSNDSLSNETADDSPSADLAHDAAALVRIAARYEPAAEALTGPPLLRRLRRSWARPAEREPLAWAAGGVLEGAQCHVDESERSAPARAVLDLRRRALRVARALHESKRTCEGLERRVAEQERVVVVLCCCGVVVVVVLLWCCGVVVVSSVTILIHLKVLFHLSYMSSSGRICRAVRHNSLSHLTCRAGRGFGDVRGALGRGGDTWR